jgi:lincosamide nucleotidyltransferase A/C/D/E
MASWDGADFSTAYFDRQPDGTFPVLGRWAGWVFPAGSFGGEPGVLDGADVPAMSAVGMLAMKEQYPALRNGGSWRAKDKTDVEVLRVLASESGARS